MKLILLLTGSFIGVMAISCSRNKEKSAEELLKDPQMENNLYTAILNNSDHFTKFMDKAMADEMGRTLMTNNPSMLKMMCTSNNMDTLLSSDQLLKEIFTERFVSELERDSTLCDHTCTRLKKNEQLNNFFKKQLSNPLKEK